MTRSANKCSQERTAPWALAPILPGLRVEGAPGSTAEIAVEFIGGLRSYYERDIVNVYDEAIADRKFEQVNATFRKEVEAQWEQLRRQQAS